MSAAELVALIVFVAAAVALCLRWLHKVTDPDLPIRRREAMLDALAKLPAHLGNGWPVRPGKGWR